MRKTLAICGKGNSTTRLTLRVHTDVDSDVCKCRCRMSTEFPANVDGNVENISIYHGKKAQKNQNFMLEKCRIICRYIYIYIYIYTHTHTPTKRLSFEAFSRLKVQKLGTKSKKCQCRLKRPANVENMSMSMVPPNVDLIWSTSVWTLNSLSCWTTPWEKDFIHSNCQGRSARLRLF